MVIKSLTLKNRDVHKSRMNIKINLYLIYLQNLEYLLLTFKTIFVEEKYMKKERGL